MRNRSENFERLLLLLLGAFVVAICIAGCALFAKQKKDLKEAATQRLSAVADLKVATLVQWWHERLEDAEIMRRMPLIADAAERFLKDPSDIRTHDDLMASLIAFKEHGHYRRLLLLDPEMQTRFAIPQEEGAVGEVSPPYVEAAFHTNRVLHSDLHQGTFSRRVNMDLYIPLRLPTAHSPTTKATAVLMVEIDPTEFLFPQIQTWPTSSRTAETLLIRKDGEDVVFLNELRHRANTSMTLRFPISSSPELPAARAVSGVQGVFEGRDYRGVQVISACRRVPGLQWSLVAKQDLEEILAPLRYTALAIVAVLGVIVLMASLGVMMLWRRREFQFARHELSAQKESERKLKDSYSILRATFDSTVDGILAVDSEGRISEYNEQFVKLWNLPQHVFEKGDSEGPLQHVLSQLKDPKSFLDRVRELESQPEASSSEFIEFKDGRVFERHSKPRWVEGRPTGRVWCFHDITQRRLSELEKERLNSELQEKNKELEYLIYAASHDLRSPLVNIEGFGRRLEKACRELSAAEMVAAVSEPLREKFVRLTQADIPKAMGYIRSGVSKMNAQIAGLLQLSRLGQVTVHATSIDVSKTVNQILTTMAYQIQKVRASVVVGDLPMCQGDPLLITQVFSNLLDNALKYRDPQRPMNIQVLGKIAGDEVIYSVADTGIGIPAESREKIWELFHRIHPEGGATGDGLGLNLVRRILDRHHGRTWVESTPGQGSTFFVALPAVKNIASTAPAVINN